MKHTHQCKDVAKTAKIINEHNTSFKQQYKHTYVKGLSSSSSRRICTLHLPKKLTENDNFLFLYFFT